MISTIFKTILVQCFLFFGHCNSQTTIKKSTHETIKTSLSDTLQVGYTYWWPESGPFIGNCGNEYSFVFIGTVKNIDNPLEDSTKLYTSQKGLIEINEVLTLRNLKSNTNTQLKYFMSDCFNDLNVKEGDRVIVFCYEYEENYSIPGGKSILKIDNINSPIVISIKKYIESNQNPLSIKQDVTLWKMYDLDTQLKQIIECEEMMSK